MYRGIPISMLDHLLCPLDAGHFDASLVKASSKRLWDASLCCSVCGRGYPVKDGILRLLDENLLDPESAHEREIRDRELDARFDPTGEGSDWNMAEIIPMIEASEPLHNRRLLELGAGSGRHTVRLAARGAEIVAVDFSLRSLQRLAARAEESWKIALVQGDCTKLEVAGASFDLVMSTLVSNLPTADHRAAMMRLAATALKPSGKFVFSAHYFGLNSRRRGESRSARYSTAGIYRYLFRVSELERETRAFFADVTSRRIQIVLPLIQRLGLSLLPTSRFAERVPGLNLFAELLLVVASSAKSVAPGHRAERVV